MGIIFDIQRLSIHDGPGLRTTVFLKGCPLRCKWCHNPEGLSRKIQLKYMDEKCILCRKCIAVCSQKVHEIIHNMHMVDFEKCNVCGMCIKECPSTALELWGQEFTAQEVIRLVSSDEPFFGEEGGITFSGGEVMMQPEFLLEMLQEAKKHSYNTCVDTSGYTKWENIEKILPYTDCFLYDIKAYSEEIHMAGTGCSNQRILENFKRLVQEQKKIYVRIPVIEEFNATTEEMGKIAGLLQEYPVMGVTLMPYHVLGRAKRSFIGMDLGTVYHAPSEKKMEEFQKLFLKHGVKLV